MLLPKQKDNLIPNGWDSFELVGNKPNLIPDGWDSFVPYGSGENLATNWDFSDGVTGWGINDDVKREVVDGSLRIYDGKGSFASVFQDINIPEGDYIIRVKRNPKSNVKGVIRGIGTDDVIKAMEDDVFEIEANVLKRFRLYLYAQNEFREIVEGGEFWIDWIQITPKDNQHLVVEKTPLENGLTHIQTWGGDNIIKIRSPHSLSIDKTTAFSTLIQSKNDIRIDNNDNQSVIVKHKDFINITTKNGKDYNRIQFADLSGKGLDFIASDPQIVEGDKPNLTMLKEDLGNGLTRIITFGGQEDSKLRFEKPFDNEDLTFSTYLENVGEESLGIKSFDNKTEYYEPDFKGMVEQHGKG